MSYKANHLRNRAILIFVALVVLVWAPPILITEQFPERYDLPIIQRWELLLAIGMTVIGFIISARWYSVKKYLFDKEEKKKNLMQSIQQNSRNANE
jgi:type VI protein secretion system component VasK